MTKFKKIELIELTEVEKEAIFASARFEEDEEVEDVLEFGTIAVLDLISRSKMTEEETRAAIASLDAKGMLYSDKLKQGLFKYSTMGIEYALWVCGYHDDQSIQTLLYYQCPELFA